MKEYGIFINYRREDKYFAGRVYDFLKARGFDPFMDFKLSQGVYKKELENRIKNTPYFLLVLSKNSLEGLRPDDPDDIYYLEIKTAIESERKLLLVADSEFNFEGVVLPEEIKGLKDHQHYKINEDTSSFFDVMNELCVKDIDTRELVGVLNWREYLNHIANVFVGSRAQLEDRISTFENRFGRDMVDCVRKGETFTGEQMIRQINMSCYAASLIFSPEINHVDARAYDYGMMFNIVAELLNDKEFSINLITNSPDSPSAIDAVEAKKMGNSAFEENPRMIFLSSFSSIGELVKVDPYNTAWKEKRFKFKMTDTVLPFAYFQVIYKEQWEEFNHIKIDLYTEGLTSNVERPSMIFFEKDHRDIYRFLQNQFNHLKERSTIVSKSYFEKHQEWIDEWEAYKREFE